jgi:hypothetical protein
MEIGSTATDFEHRGIGEELALCERYFTKSFPYGTAPAQNAGITGAITAEGQAASSPAYAYVTFKNTMRATPTIVTFNPNDTNANWRNTTSGGALTVAVQFTGDAGTFIGSNTEVLAQYQLCAIHYTASAEL